MLKLIKQAIFQYNMLQKGDKVLCALSGGADSVALVLMLKDLEKELQIEICACHLNHLLRGAESNRDEEFSKKLCEKVGIEFISIKCDAKKYADDRNMSVETGARELRYKFFDSCAEKTGATKIATAHTASDNLETVIFNLVRGTASKGLCGIPPVRDNIIRPLIFLSREHIEKYLKQNNQDFVTDSSNLTNEYTRNKIRHNVIPVLHQINEKAEQNAVKMADVLRSDIDFLDKEAQKAIKDIVTQYDNEVFLDVEKAKQCHKAVLSRVFQKIFATKFRISLENIHIKELLSILECKNPSASICLKNDVLAHREYNQLKIYIKKELKIINQIPLKIGQIVEIFGGKIVLKLSILEKKPQINNSLNTFYVSCDTIDFDTLVVRSRKQGDKIAFCKKSGHKTIKKLFIDRKIPRNKREVIPIIADKNGIICIYSIGCNVDRIQERGEILEIKFEER